MNFGRIKNNSTTSKDSRQQKKRASAREGRGGRGYSDTDKLMLEHGSSEEKQELWDLLSPSKNNPKMHKNIRTVDSSKIKMQPLKWQ